MICTLGVMLGSSMHRVGAVLSKPRCTVHSDRDVANDEEMSTVTIEIWDCERCEWRLRFHLNLLCDEDARTFEPCIHVKAIEVRQQDLASTMNAGL